MHHTGIKTYVFPRTLLSENNFNCTIQELKQDLPRIDLVLGGYFNCTIQELKQSKQLERAVDAENFNCTIQELKRGVYFIFIAHISISIAPYRN